MKSQERKLRKYLNLLDNTRENEDLFTSESFQNYYSTLLENRDGFEETLKDIYYHIEEITKLLEKPNSKILLWILHRRLKELNESKSIFETALSKTNEHIIHYNWKRLNLIT